jgi:hypothetical protein
LAGDLKFKAVACYLARDGFELFLWPVSIKRVSIKG